jgi:MiaB/RimO family radical SAM methylthiotransferase
MKVYIEYMGCPNRGMDATRFERYFRLNGCRIVNSPRIASHMIYISCAFRKEREDNAIDRIKYLSRYKGRLIVAGCLKGINPQRLEENFKGISLVAADHDAIDKIFPQFRVKFNQAGDGNMVYPVGLWQFFKENFFVFRCDFNFLSRVIFYFRRRVARNYCYIRISWGCETEHCRFCVIWRAIGPLRSKSIIDCVSELKAAVIKGVRRIILVANNSGAYGMDSNSSLPELVKALMSVPGKFSIEIEDLHPSWLIRYIEELVPLLRLGKISVLHCPLQSGSDRMLKFMNRRHTVAQLQDACRKLRDAWPALQINTHILVGFATETNDDFYQTLALLKDIRPYLVHIHGYSNHPHLQDKEVLEHRLSDEIIQFRLEESVRFCKRNGIICSLA